MLVITNVPQASNSSLPRPGDGIIRTNAKDFNEFDNLSAKVFAASYTAMRQGTHLALLSPSKSITLCDYVHSIPCHACKIAQPERKIEYTFSGVHVRLWTPMPVCTSLI